MAVTNWNVVVRNGRRWLIVDVAQFQIPLDWDPSSNMIIAIAAPDGGFGAFPGLVKGDDGPAPQLVAGAFNALAATDPTPDSYNITQTGVTPQGGPIYRVDVALHKGANGTPGGTVLHTATDLSGTAVPLKSIMVLNSTSDGFVYQSQKVGDRYYPATIVGAPSGQSVFTVATVSVPGQPNDWRPEPGGWTVVTGDGADIAVDYVARLSATSGNDIGRATQRAGQYPATHTLMGGCPPNIADGYDRVAAAAATTSTNIYFNVEKQSGANSFTTQASTTRAWVKVRPIP